MEMNNCINVHESTLKLSREADWQDFLTSAHSTQVTAQLFANYSENVRYNLEALGKMPEPK